MRRRARHVGGKRGDVVLELRCGGRVVYTSEDSTLIDADRHRSAAGEDVIERDGKRPPPTLEIIVGRDRLRALEDHASLEMILQVLTDAGQFVHDADAELFEERPRPDT